VARGFGLAAWRVEQSADLASAFTAAAVHEGPSLIDVRLDPSGYPDQLRALRG
jgi:acetolactate synthase-1/2/3 large subunit